MGMPHTPGQPRTAGVGQGAIIVVAAFLPIMAIVAMAPALPSFLGHFKGQANAGVWGPLMVTAPGLMIAIFAPLMGWAADRWGRRPVLLTATLLYGFVGTLPFFLDQLAPIFASRLALGVTEAAILTVTNTLLGDYYDVPQRRKWLTVQGIVGPVFGTSVIALSGVLTSQVWNGAFLIYGVALLIFLAMLVYIYEPVRGAATHDAVEATGQPFPWRAVAAFSTVTLFSSTLYYVFIVQGGLAFDALGVTSPRTLGLIISGVSVGVPVGAVIFGLLSRRLSPAGLVAIYLSLLGLGMLGVGLSRTVETMAASAFVQQIGAGMSIPSLILWATGSLSAGQRGRGMGVWAAVFFLGQFLSPLAVGSVRAITGGILGAFAVMGVIALAGGTLGFVMMLRGASRRGAAAAPAG